MRLHSSQLPNTPLTEIADLEDESNSQGGDQAANNFLRGPRNDTELTPRNPGWSVGSGAEREIHVKIEIDFGVKKKQIRGPCELASSRP